MSAYQQKIKNMSSWQADLWRTYLLSLHVRSISSMPPGTSGHRCPDELWHRACLSPRPWGPWLRLRDLRHSCRNRERVKVFLRNKFELNSQWRTERVFSPRHAGERKNSRWFCKSGGWGVLTHSWADSISQLRLLAMSSCGFSSCTWRERGRDIFLFLQGPDLVRLDSHSYDLIYP